MKGGAEERVREPFPRVLARASLTYGFSERELYLLRIILEYRARGYGAMRIGRILWPSLKPRTAQKRVQRILAKAESAGIPVEDPEEALMALSHRLGAVETPVSISDETSRRRVSRNEDKSAEGVLALEPWESPLWGPTPSNLGRTQRLVLAALYSLGGRARFSAIVNEVLALMGIEGHLIPRSRLRNRVWQALRRLAGRGIVDFDKGVYWLAARFGGPDLFVENFRVETFAKKNVQVWAKGGKNGGGRALRLVEALIQSTLLGSLKTLQVEVAGILKDERFKDLMDTLGISIIKVYRDPSYPYLMWPKLEIAFERPPLRPNIAETERWVSAYHNVVKELRRAMTNLVGVERR